MVLDFNKLYQQYKARYLNIRDNSRSENVHCYLFGYIIGSHHYSFGYKNKELMEQFQEVIYFRRKEEGLIIPFNVRFPDSKVGFQTIVDFQDGYDKNGYSKLLDETFPFPPDFDERIYEFFLELAADNDYPLCCYYYLSGRIRGNLNELSMDVSKFTHLYENIFPKWYVEQYGKEINTLDNYFDEIGFKYEFQLDPVRIAITDDSYITFHQRLIESCKNS